MGWTDRYVAYINDEVVGTYTCKREAERGLKKLAKEMFGRQDAFSGHRLKEGLEYAISAGGKYATFRYERS